MTRESRPAELDRRLHDVAGDLRVHLERRLRAREVADSVLAETLLRAGRGSRDLPEDTEPLRMWLFVIAANVLADRHHSTRRRHWPQATSDRDGGGADAVGDALRLHTAQRELLMLIERSGLGIVEAARLLGLGTPAGGSTYAAAREHLRQALVSATGR